MSVQQNWEDQKRKRQAFFRSLYDYIMGVLWLGLGLFFLFNKKLGIDWMKSDPVIDTLFGGVGIAYGLFRLYRGYQRSHFKK
jgi:uncharacterized membrane protein